MISYYDFNEVATVIDVTLYKYNYIDNRIITMIKNQLDYKEVNDGSIVVTSSQLQLLLTENFSSDINRINATGSDQFHKEATSIYFLNKIISDFRNLEYMKITINTNKVYSRLSEIEGQKTLRFNFKIIAGTIKLYDIFQDEEDLKQINSILISLDIMKENVPYARHNVSTIFTALDVYCAAREGGDNTQIDTALDLLDCLEAKVQDDNPKILLITDY